MVDEEDVEDVKFVINYDYPNSSEDYVHRIGRTGRSQQTGTAYTFFTRNSAKQAADLILVLSEANQPIHPKLREMADEFQSRNYGFSSSKMRYRRSDGRGKPSYEPYTKRDTPVRAKSRSRSRERYGNNSGMNGRRNDDVDSKSRFNRMPPSFVPSQPPPPTSQPSTQPPRPALPPPNHSVAQSLPANVPVSAATTPSTMKSAPPQQQYPPQPYYYSMPPPPPPNAAVANQNTTPVNPPLPSQPPPPQPRLPQQPPPPQSHQPHPHSQQPQMPQPQQLPQQHCIPYPYYQQYMANYAYAAAAAAAAGYAPQ